MDADIALRGRAATDLATGRLAYEDIALHVFRRLCARSGQGGLAVGSGEFAAPLMSDLAAQPEIERVILFGLNRRRSDRLRSEMSAAGDDMTIDLRKPGLGTDGGERIDTALEGLAPACAYMALSLPPGDLGPLEGAGGRLAADRPIILLDLGDRSGPARQGWAATVAAFLSGHGYRMIDGCGRPASEGAASAAGASAAGASAGGVDRILWAFPDGAVSDAGTVIALAAAKASADADAIRR